MDRHALSQLAERLRTKRLYGYWLAGRQLNAALRDAAYGDNRLSQVAEALGALDLHVSTNLLGKARTLASIWDSDTARTATGAGMSFRRALNLVFVESAARDKEGTVPAQIKDRRAALVRGYVAASKSRDARKALRAWDTAVDAFRSRVAGDAPVLNNKRMARLARSIPVQIDKLLSQLRAAEGLGGRLDFQRDRKRLKKLKKTVRTKFQAANS